MPDSRVISGFANMEPSHYCTFVKSLGHLGLVMEPLRPESSVTSGDTAAFSLDDLPETGFTASGLLKLPTFDDGPQDYGIGKQDIVDAANEIGKPRMANRIFNTLSRNTKGGFIYQGERFFSYRELSDLLVESVSGVTPANRWPNTGKTAVEILRLIVSDKRAAIELEEQIVTEDT